MIIGFPHKPQFRGGPGSFQERMEIALKLRGDQVVYPEDELLPEVILVVGGTSQLRWLSRCKRQGSRVVHRLDGLNWRHRVEKTGVSHWMISEIRNKLMRYVRDKLADDVVYQSQFVMNWWHDKFGSALGREHIIYNAVDVKEFRPYTGQRTGLPILVSVEGVIQGDAATLEMVKHLSQQLIVSGRVQSLRMYGHLEPRAEELFGSIPGVEMCGAVPRDKIPGRLRDCDIFVNLEINPPCPNSVIEAMATGLPILGYDTGSLNELVGMGGYLAEYSTDPWKLGQPSKNYLTEAANKVLLSREHLSYHARRIACERFSLNDMVQKYTDILIA
ncbi:glycosyltransferase family 4 protein [Burkholderiales bacterium]|nr:glycosyltransferase family 4 protein [Burkholderiales bacterium]